MSAEYASFGLAPAMRAGGVLANGDYQVHRDFVDFVVDGALCTGFTHDVSFTGFFVISSRLPQIGTMLPATIHLPDGKRVTMTGKVVRSRRVPPALAQTFANGFSMQLTGYSEEYTRFVSSLH